MNWPAILKTPPSGKATPNLCDYGQTCANFSWEQARAELDRLLLMTRELGLPEGDTSTLEVS